MSSRIETLGGHFVDPLAMNPADLRIEDIAHSLSMLCRFNGYTSRFYSVAEHSVYVARLVMARLSNKLWPHQDWAVLADPHKRRIVRQALLHDATEAYVSDMVAPLKRHFPEFRAAEKNLWIAVAGWGNVSEGLHEYVHEADMRMCTTEKMALLSDVITEQEWGAFLREYPPYTGAWDIIDRYEVTPALARRRFLDFYQQVKD